MAETVALGPSRNGSEKQDPGVAEHAQPAGRPAAGLPRLFCPLRCCVSLLPTPGPDSPTPRTPCPSVPVNRSSAHSWTLFSSLNPSSNEHSLCLRSFLDDPALLGLDPSPRPPTRGHFLPLRTQPPPPLPCLCAAFPRVGAGTTGLTVLPSSWAGVETLKRLLKVCRCLPAPTLRRPEVCE